MLYFVKFKDLTRNFCGFYHFIYFSTSFYPIWMKFILKFREYLGLHDYQLGLVQDRSFSNKLERPGLRSSQDRSWSWSSPRSYAVLRTGLLSTMR